MKNKRIAILTLPPIFNYGGILQNFALQQALLKLGFDPITIDRRSSSFLKEFLRRVKIHSYNRLIGRRYLTFNKELKDYIYREPSLFKSKYLIVTEPVFSSKDLKVKTDFLNINCFVVGSDQVWRPPYNPNIYNYYLDFIKDKSDIKKIAYAASFGVDEWEYSKTQTRKSQKLALLFDKISVREHSALKLCSEFLKVEATCVVDPTMLLTREDYLNLIDYSKVPKRGGLYTYLLDDNTIKRNLVKQVEETLQLVEYNNQPNAFQGDVSKNVEDYVFPSVEGWIKGFDQADFIITDSFHGTVFSIIFNKPFLVYANSERGVARFKSILALFNLDSRLIFNLSEFTREVIVEPINWTEVNEKIEIERCKSMLFLSNCLL